VRRRILVSVSFKWPCQISILKAEEIVNKLRQADLGLAGGSTLAAVCSLPEITEATRSR